MIVIGDAIGDDSGADLCGVICAVALDGRLELVCEGAVNEAYCEHSTCDKGDGGGDIEEAVDEVGYAVMVRGHISATTMVGFYGTSLACRCSGEEDDKEEEDEEEDDDDSEDDDESNGGDEDEGASGCRSFGGGNGAGCTIGGGNTKGWK
ncbi:hypothetical protein J3E68DRAFT_429392 [Trichoderma sp. SZMC 28012]